MRLKANRARDSAVRSPEEVERRRIPWGKYLYLAVLALLLVVAVRWAARLSLFVRGQGIVQGETTHVQARVTARIEDIKCRVTDRVVAGQELVTIDMAETEQQIREQRRAYEQDIRAIERRALAARHELALAQEARDGTEQALGDLEKELAAINDLIAGGAATRVEAAAVEKKLQPVRSELALRRLAAELAQAEVAAVGAEAGEVRAAMDADVSALQALLEDRVLLAPHAGVVTWVDKRPGEVCRPGETILTLADEEDPYVLTYFAEEDVDLVAQGTEVTVVLPNGTRIAGTVRRVYPSALPLPPDYGKQFGPRERHVVAEVGVAGGLLEGSPIGSRAEVLVERGWLRRVKGD
jgi:multidrug resistance efflux pump